MVRKYVKALMTLSIITITLVGCGKAEQTGASNEIATIESTMTENAAVAENEVVTPATTEAPTEEPTPTPEPVHEHSYSETIIKEGSCTSLGTKLYKCSCGYSYEKEYVLDHVSDGNRVVTKEPTCSSNGTTAEHCIYCNISMYGKSVPATEYTPKDHWEYFTHTGNYYLACSICNRVITHTTTRPEGVEINEITPIDSDTLKPIK